MGTPRTCARSSSAAASTSGIAHYSCLRPRSASTRHARCPLFSGPSPLAHCPLLQPLQPAPHHNRPANPTSSSSSGLPSSRLAARAFEQGSNGGAKDPSLEEYVEVKVDSVRVSQGACVVYLRVLDGKNMVLPVHIGENESNALLKEINKQRQMRPLTHDVMKNILQTLSFRVTKIRITDIVANTYYARIHLARMNSQGVAESDEVDVDARPSDAINLAVRFGAPMYVNKRIAETASQHQVDSYSYASTNETHAEIVRSVRETLASFEDPTVMYQLQKELAIQEERFEDAQAFQQHIYHEMTHNSLLRLVVAMEAALSDARYEEAARLRDEYKRSMQTQQQQQQQNATPNDRAR